MKNIKNYLPVLIFAFCFSITSYSQKIMPKEISRLEKLAQQVTIIRDQWGIAHVNGNTDADAVFGMLYAQCEDDFKRVELNYIEKLGRLSEIKGQAVLYNDLEIKLHISVLKNMVVDIFFQKNYLKIQML
jgi:acyl-homoserine lactone acylase PvdQ